jgi:hypothetical protein
MDYPISHAGDLFPIHGIVLGPEIVAQLFGGFAYDFEASRERSFQNVASGKSDGIGLCRLLEQEGAFRQDMLQIVPIKV